MKNENLLLALGLLNILLYVIAFYYFAKTLMQLFSNKSNNLIMSYYSILINLCFFGTSIIENSIFGSILFAVLTILSIFIYFAYKKSEEPIG